MPLKQISRLYAFQDIWSGYIASSRATSFATRSSSSDDMLGRNRGGFLERAGRPFSSRIDISSHVCSIKWLVAKHGSVFVFEKKEQDVGDDGGGESGQTMMEM